MATPTDSDVAAGIRTRWAATSSLNSIIASTAAWRGRAPERAAFPYARFNVTESDRELTSGSAYLARFRVDIDCYVSADPPAAATLRAALDAAFNGTATTPAAGLTVSNATVLTCAALPGTTSRPTTERVDGKDVVRVSASFEVYLIGTR